MNDNRYVAYADVLGFKELVRTNPHEQLLTIYKGTLQMAADYGASGGLSYLPAEPAQDPIPAVDRATLNMQIISDSVLLWTDDDTSVQFITLVMAVSRLLAAGLASGTPLRGAISWGPASHWRQTYDNPRLGLDSLVGAALVDAYEGERMQDWSGAYVLPSAIDRYKEVSGHLAPSLQHLQDSHWLHYYPVPFKEQASREMFAIDWTRHFSHELSEGGIRNSFEESGKQLPGAETKLEHTVSFARSLGRL